MIYLSESFNCYSFQFSMHFDSLFEQINHKIKQTENQKCQTYHTSYKHFIFNTRKMPFTHFVEESGSILAVNDSNTIHIIILHEPCDCFSFDIVYMHWTNSV